MNDFHDFLEGEALTSREGGRFALRCSICTNPELAKEVAEYAAGRQDGTIAFSIWQIWKRYFRPQRGIGSPTTLDTHIRHHLGIDL